jgi:hypothetical protein
MASQWENRSKWTLGVLSHPETDEVPGRIVPYYLLDVCVNLCGEKAQFFFSLPTETNLWVCGTSQLERRPHHSLLHCRRADRLLVQSLPWPKRRQMGVLFYTLSRRTRQMILSIGPAGVEMPPSFHWASTASWEVE